ncbi:MAG: YbaN family protein [Actinomycetaceae bacterium]|nr:YbaN family protein [Arcanobacterium sp.]MDD7687224.1 YbaN family protein [Actinomycetaceae bacterium]MDY5273478.1 YbaN family protein [Arcanobacterium sp.]
MNVKKLVMMALGFLFTGLAFLGVVLPVLPTTPFLLLAVFFFARSSERWHHYLLNHRIFGQYLTDYYNHEMTISNKWRTLALMWIGMGICMWLLRGKLWLVILLAVIAIGVTIHLVSLRSVTPEESASRKLSPKDSEEPGAKKLSGGEKLYGETLGEEALNQEELRGEKAEENNECLHL